MREERGKKSTSFIWGGAFLYHQSKGLLFSRNLYAASGEKKERTNREGAGPKRIDRAHRSGREKMPIVEKSSLTTQKKRGEGEGPIIEYRGKKKG